jgi:hypothetical protein
MSEVGCTVSLKPSVSGRQFKWLSATAGSAPSLCRQSSSPARAASGTTALVSAAEPEPLSSSQGARPAPATGVMQISPLRSPGRLPRLG